MRIQKNITVDVDVLKKFYELFPNMNFSLWVEEKMKEKIIEAGESI